MASCLNNYVIYWFEEFYVDKMSWEVWGVRMHLLSKLPQPFTFPQWKDVIYIFTLDIDSHQRDICDFI